MVTKEKNKNLKPLFIHRKASIFSFVLLFLSSFLAIGFLYTFNAPIASAVINEKINYQGRLTDHNNFEVADGGYDMLFKLYDSTNALLWTEVWNGGTSQVQVRNGTFSVLLGTHSSLSAINFSQTLYLGVTVGTDAEMTPRKEIGAVPAAFEAKKLGGFTWAVPGTLGSGTPNTGKFTTAEIVNSGNALVMSGNGANIQFTGTGVSQITTASNQHLALMPAGSGNVGIGTSSPTNAKLQITDTTTTASFAGFRVDQSGAMAGTGYGIYVTKTGASTTNVAGYFSATGATNNYGLIVENGFVGIGTLNPINKFQVVNDGGLQKSYFDTYGGAGAGSYVFLRSSRGSVASPSAVQNTDTLGGFYFGGQYDTTPGNFGNQVGIFGLATESWTATNRGSAISFEITPIGSTARAARLYIDSSGNIGIGTGTSTVTQGRLVVSDSTTTAGFAGFYVSQTGAVTGTGYGLYVTKTGASTVANVAGYFEASGGTANYGLIVNGGDVGIGLTAPTHKFQITDTNTTANRAGIYVLQSGTITGTGYGLYVNKTGFSTTNVGGYFSATGGTNNYGLLVANGSVGFSTILPASKLDIYGTFSATSSDSIAYTASKSTTTTITSTVGTFTSSDVGKFFVWADGKVDKITGYTDPNNVTIVASATVASQTGYTRQSNMTVDSSGNVGVGTANPTFAFEVNGNSATVINRVINSGTINSTQAAIQIGLSGSATFQAGGGPAYLFFSPDSLGNKEYMGRISSLWENNTNGSEAGAIAFNVRANTADTNATTERMRIAANGYVGIGVTTITAGLDVQNAVTAATGFGRGVNFAQSLVAAANSDIMTALRIAPAYTNGAFTGLANYGIHVTQSIAESVTLNYSGMLVENSGTGDSSMRFYSSNGTAQNIVMGIDANDNKNFKIGNAGTPFSLTGTTYSDANTLMRIHTEAGSEGIIDLNHQSRARAYLNTATQNLPAATWTKVQFNAETFDEKSEFDSTTNYRFTAKEDGYYQVNARVRVVPPGTIGNSGYSEIALYLQGAVYSYGNMLSTSDAGSDDFDYNGGLILSDLIYMTAGQYIEIWSYQNPANANAATITNGSAETYVSIHKSS